jgi:transcriptional regulator with XRE-family HTH domain
MKKVYVDGDKLEGRARNYQLQEEIDYATIGRHMREYRKAKNYTQARFAELLGMSANYYGQYETGAHRINFPRFVQFVCATGCSADQLLVGCHADYPSQANLSSAYSEQRKKLNALLDKCPDDMIADLIEITQVLLKRP